MVVVGGEEVEVKIMWWLVSRQKLTDLAGDTWKTFLAGRASRVHISRARSSTIRAPSKHRAEDNRINYNNL